MRKDLVMYFLCGIIVLLSPRVFADSPDGSVQTGNQDWEAVRQTSPNVKLRIEKKDGKKITGRVYSISDTELQIKRKGKIESIDRSEVGKIWRISPPNRIKKNILVFIGTYFGTVAGLTLGIAIGMNPCGDSCVDDGAGAIALMFGLPVAGYYAGKLLAGSGKRTLIYSAP